MPLVIEDGTCIAGSDSWVSLEDAATHFANYGGFWAGADPEKESALRRAALWLSTSIKWNGTKQCTGTMLAWPRSGVSDCDGIAIAPNTIPAAVILAQLAAASFELQNPGGLTPPVTPSQQVRREKVDVIEVEYMTPLQQGAAPGSYDPAAAARPILTQINDYLRCLANIDGTCVPWPFVV